MSIPFAFQMTRFVSRLSLESMVSMFCGSCGLGLGSEGFGIAAEEEGLEEGSEGAEGVLSERSC